MLGEYAQMLHMECTNVFASARMIIIMPAYQINILIKKELKTI